VVGQVDGKYANPLGRDWPLHALVPVVEEEMGDRGEGGRRRGREGGREGGRGGGWRGGVFLWILLHFGKANQSVGRPQHYYHHYYYYYHYHYYYYYYYYCC